MGFNFYVVRVRHIEKLLESNVDDVNNLVKNQLSAGAGVEYSRLVDGDELFSIS